MLHNSGDDTRDDQRSSELDLAKFPGYDIYWLKQAGCGWYQKMSQVLVKDLRFTCSAVDHLVFFQHSPDEHTIITATMDDMAVTLK